ncbi:MAG: phosphoribosyltransferase family protein [Spirosomataceae bacterium]
MSSPKTLLLDASQMNQKIRRMAYQIYERNMDEPVLVIAGIQGEGFALATRLVDVLKEITPIEVIIAEISFDKTSEIQPDIHIQSEVDTFRFKPVILVDDVLNTGRTLAYSLRPFMTIPLKQIQVAVLVDRNHPKYPIAADYIGYSLSTTLNEHVEVSISSQKPGVYLY